MSARPPRAAGLLGLGLLALLAAAGCRRAPARPPRDALQEALRSGGLSEREARGRRVFLAQCATCHGSEGRGDGQNAYNLDPPPPDFQQSLARLSAAERRRVIVSGTAALGRSPLCPPRAGTLDPEAVEALAAWLDLVAHRQQTPPGEPRQR